jgi:hypothetical protein
MFFTTNGCGARSCSRIAFRKMRTNVSLPPPAAKGTITVIGFSGNGAAAAQKIAHRKTPATIPRRNSENAVMKARPTCGVLANNATTS